MKAAPFTLRRPGTVAEAVAALAEGGTVLAGGQSLMPLLAMRTIEAATGATRLSREIRYLIGVPESEDRWLEVTASLAVLKSEGSDELLAAITEFADRWVETIEWVPEEDETSA